MIPWSHSLGWSKLLLLLLIKGNLKPFLIEFEACLSLTNWIVFSVGLRMRWGSLWECWVPRLLMKPLDFAKMQEEYLWSCRKYSKNSYDGSRKSVLGAPKLENNNPTPKSRVRVPLQRLIAAQMGERKKGLCYNCDEKWQSGHHCKGAKIFLLGVPFFHELPSFGP